MNEDILEFLKSNNISVVSVVRPDGSVHAAALHFSNNIEGTEFYFATTRGSRKVEGVVDGGSAKSSIVVGFKEEEMITLQMDGTIKAAIDSADKEKVKSAHYIKHPHGKDYADHPDTLHLIFTPDWWRFSKLKEKPPVFIDSK